VFRQCSSPATTNRLPFYWSGFEVAVRYTYRIEDLIDLDCVQRGLRGFSGRQTQYLRIHKTAPKAEPALQRARAAVDKMSRRG
jgi:hypothetical protein